MYPGYFVLVYQWDHRCYTPMESIRKRFHNVSRELGELELQTARDTVTLLNFYKKWHSNKELYQRTITEVQKRQFVIDSLGYRGYGVNRDLYGALVSVKKEYAEHLSWLLRERFKKHIPSVKRIMRLPQEAIDSGNSDYIITGLCKKLKNLLIRIFQRADIHGGEPESLFSGHEENPVADKYRHLSEVILKYRQLIHDFDKGLYGISQPSVRPGI